MEDCEWLECDALESDPERVSGTVVFKNTRLPVRAVVENVDSFMEVEGMSLDEAMAETLSCYPGVPGGWRAFVRCFYSAPLTNINCNLEGAAG